MFVFSAKDSENWYSSDEEGDDTGAASLTSLIKTVRSNTDTAVTSNTQQPQQPMLSQANSTPSTPSTSQHLPNALANLFANTSNTSENDATKNALNSILGFVQRQTSQSGTSQASNSNPVSNMLSGLMSSSGGMSPSSSTNGFRLLEAIHTPGRTDPREGRERKDKSEMRFRVLHWGKNEYSVKYEEDRPSLPPIELTTPTEIKLSPFIPPPEIPKQAPVDPRAARPTDPRTKRPQDPRLQQGGGFPQQDMNRDPRFQNRDPRLAGQQSGSPGPMDQMGDGSGGMQNMNPMGDGMLPIPGGPPQQQMNMGPMRFPMPPRGQQRPPGPGMGFPPRMPMRGMPPRGMPPRGPGFGGPGPGGPGPGGPGFRGPRPGGPGPGPGFGGPPGPRHRFGRPPFGSPPHRMMGPGGPGSMGPGGPGPGGPRHPMNDPRMNDPRMHMGGSPRMDGPPAPFGMQDQRGPRPNARFGGPMQQMPMQGPGDNMMMMNRQPGPQNQNMNSAGNQQGPNQAQRPTDPRLARQLSQSKLSDPRTQPNQQGSASPQQGDAQSPLEAGSAPKFSANVRTTQTDPRLRPRNTDPRLAKQEAASEKSAQSKEGFGGNSPDPSIERDSLKRPADKKGGLSMYSIPKKAKRTDPVEADSTSDNANSKGEIEHRLVPSAHHRLQQTASFNQGPSGPNNKGSQQNVTNTRVEAPTPESAEAIPADVLPAEDISLKDMFKVKDPTASPFC